MSLSLSYLLIFSYTNDIQWGPRVFLYFDFQWMDKNKQLRLSNLEAKTSNNFFTYI